MVQGNTVSVDVAAKGSGSANESQVQGDGTPSDFDRRLGAGDGADRWAPVVPAGHARASASAARRSSAMLLAKEALMEPIDMARAQDCAARRPRSRSCGIELFDKVNALGIGAQGLGGLSTGA